MQQDTIFALSTPPGKSGVAVIRVSGTQTSDVLLGLTKKDALPPTRQAQLASLYAEDGAVIDKALILYFKAPNSFTGEDVLELHTHGGVAVIQGVLGALGNVVGVRPAEPGEFMRRAFFNEKVDLLEAEAIADMIDAETSAQLAQANKQMRGHHSEYYHRLRNSIVEILALLEAYIDFPEEDIPEEVLAQVEENIGALKKQIEDSVRDNHIGERIRSGFRISIIGPPNAGKSTLLNALSGREAAIVSSHAGTTRDLIELHMDVAGYPVVLCDTAGIRESEDEVELLGIERSQQSLGMSDVVLLMVDGTSPQEDLESTLDLLGDIPAILVINKCDQLSDGELAGIDSAIHELHPALPIIAMAAKDADGLDALEHRITQCLDGLMPQEDVWITRARHRDLLNTACDHLDKSIDDLPLELFCEEIRLASVSIGKITGKIITDELLEVIFSRFCIGK